MAFEFDPTQRYDMPVVFGPSLLPDVTVMEDLRNISVPFLTERAAIEPFLPRFFEVEGDPVVTVSSSHNGGVDWLGGRQYNVVRVQVNVRHRSSSGGHDPDHDVVGPYSLVIWESDPRPVIAGRELQGYAKIVGEIPDHERSDGRAAFECSEYGTRLVRGEVDGLAPLDESVLASLSGEREQVALGWKYIPNPEGGADADYPTKLLSTVAVSEAWTGQGTISFDAPTWQQAPSSAHIIEALRTLPVLEYRTATVVHSRVTLPRNAVIRLQPPT
jgi:Acetoacetate decarboxylase (ADC)